ncbi:MAG: PadR family transcriptional regulator [Rhodospirillaceae bacterium]|nr:PadR family transcriptional regulator [Rhodospirillaceae bacterium]
MSPRRSKALPAYRSASQAARTLMVLGLLQRGPMHGYELYRIIVAHGALYADFKKPTLYHLLERLAEDGAVKVTSEAGTRGRRGERLVYALTAAGRRIFMDLLRETLGAYQPVHSGLDVAIVFMARLPPADAIALLKTRRETVLARRALVSGEGKPPPPPERATAASLAASHALGLIDAELAWIAQAISQFASAAPPPAHT